MTLYLKYRPQKISELDLESVRESLTKIISSGKIAHAFLFAGPKGSGKTSAARILAKVINCENPKDGEPCNKCDSCIAISKGNHVDVVEMDAASHRGIDDIRALKENIALSPQSAKKKIYIMDEAHMLTTEAANAFLKTLEEPPSHVSFILATTNPEKLPDTIHSRLTTIHFRKANSSEVERQLTRVIAGEKINIDQDAIKVISGACEGSFRDAVKILEQLSSAYKHLTKDLVEEALLETKVLQTDKMLELLTNPDAQEIVKRIEDIAKQGGSIRLFIDQMLSRLHKMLLAYLEVEDGPTPLKQEEILDLIPRLQNAKAQLGNALIVQLPLELELVKWVNSKAESRTKTQPPSEVQAPKEEKKEKTQGSPKPSEIKTVEVTDSVSSEVWTKLLTTVGAKNASIEALLRAAKPLNYDGSTLTLGVYYQFHKERLESAPNRKTLEDVAAGVFGASIRVDCTLTQRPAMNKKPNETILTDAKDTDIIKAAKEIFGS